jgi:succinylarginine dihydrolase
MLTAELYNSLRRWVESHYREALRPQELSDPRLLDECRTALDELTRILGVGSIYRFQGATSKV